MKWVFSFLGFVVTESLKALALLTTTQKTSKPSKAVNGRKLSDGSRNSINDATDSMGSLNNNTKHSTGKKAMGFMNKLRKGKVAV